MQVDSVAIVKALYEESKFWVAVGGVFFSLFKGVNWLREIKTNHLHHLQQSADALHEEVKEQTQQIVKAVDTNTGELKELRNDLRTFTAVFAKPVSRKVSKRRRA